MTNQLNEISYQQHLKISKQLETKVNDLQYYIDINFEKNKNNKNINLSPEDLEKNLNKVNQQIETLKTNASELTKKNSSLYKTIKVKKVPENNIPLKEFLEKHNTVQHNGLKRLLKIPKDPLKISTKDKKKLLPLLNEIHKKEMDKIKEQFSESANQKKAIQNVKDINQAQSNLNKLQNLQNTNDQQIREIEKPIKKLIDKIIDCDVNEIKSIIKKNDISIQDILTYLTKVISSLAQKRAEKNAIKNQKYQKLKTNIEKIAKIEKKEQLQERKALKPKIA